MQSVAVPAIIFAFTLAYGIGYPHGDSQGVSPDPAKDDDSDMYLDPQHEESRYEEGDQGNQFYPSFPPFQNQPSGHSRPYYQQQEGAYSHRPQSAFQQQVAFDSPRYSGYKDDGYRAAANADSGGILGSGNFGVIRGGTFYDNDGGAGEKKNYERDFSSYFGNSHGGPFYFGGVPNPRPYQHEQFENFRDFADINTPTNPAYSQYVVVYVNKNATKEHVSRVPNNRPKNIIESLALLDLETTTTPREIESVAEKKISKSKTKLAKLLPEKKHKLKKSVTTKAQRELNEPLLALS